MVVALWIGHSILGTSAEGVEWVTKCHHPVWVGPPQHLSFAVQAFPEIILLHSSQELND